MTHQVRLLSPDDEAEVFELDEWAFGFDPDDADMESARRFLQWDRVAGVRDEESGRLVALHAALSQDLTVPGGSVPCGGLTWVGVHPEFRRRGLLRAMIDHHLADVRDRGEVVSALYAAEPSIYGRFGYGLATRWLELTVGRGAALRAAPAGSDALVARFETADLERHGKIVAEVFEQARLRRPGGTSRSEGALLGSAFHLPESLRKDQDRQRILTLSDAGGDVRAYALFVRRMDWTDTGPDGKVNVREAVALDAAAAHALWSRLLDLDLTSKVVARRRAVDDALLHLLVDVRAAGARMTDALWLRIVDVPAALAARRYQAPVDAVLDVRDDLLPENAGRWRLQGGPDGARCERTDADADLALDVRDLGAAYLGGESLTGLAAAGLVDERRPGALAAAATGFAWPVAPYSGWLF